jgi:hypothetical protein
MYLRGILQSGRSPRPSSGVPLSSILALPHQLAAQWSKETGPNSLHGRKVQFPLWVDSVEKLPDAASDETLLRQVGSPSTKDSGWSHCGFDCCVSDSRSDFINGIGH